jgi:hypothetical protein
MFDPVSGPGLIRRGLGEPLPGASTLAPRESNMHLHSLMAGLLLASTMSCIDPDDGERADECLEDGDGDGIFGEPGDCLTTDTADTGDTDTDVDTDVDTDTDY